MLTEKVALLSCIRDVHCSNIGPKPTVPLKPWADLCKVVHTKFQGMGTRVDSLELLAIILILCYIQNSAFFKCLLNKRK